LIILEFSCHKTNSSGVLLLEAVFDSLMNEGAKILVDLMSAVTTSETEAITFDEAFTLHHRTVFRAARAVVQDSGLAEDITQEVFLRLYHHQEDVKTNEMLRPWLIRVAINVARNTIRGNIRANAREENYFKETVENSMFEVEAEFEQREQITEVHRALSKIKEPLRSCLVLKQQGLSYREIAETLSLNETSIGQFVARGRKEFVRFYGKIGRDS
jgi:RNA polymerase sigma factor (sigma-70 family)